VKLLKTAEVEEHGRETAILWLMESFSILAFSVDFSRVQLVALITLSDERAVSAGALNSEGVLE